jgi:hypothetical protein
LNTDFEINNKGKTVKQVQCVQGHVWEVGINGRDENDATGFMGFKYIKETE